MDLSTGSVDLNFGAKLLSSNSTASSAQKLTTKFSLETKCNRKRYYIIVIRETIGKELGDKPYGGSTST